MEDKTFESQLTEKQFPLVKLEMLLDELINLLGDVKNEVVLNGRVSRNYPTLIKVYFNVLLRTKNTHEYDNSFEPVRGDDILTVLKKIEGYLNVLEKKGIYCLGKEEVVFWKTGNR